MRHSDRRAFLGMIGALLAGPLLSARAAAGPAPELQQAGALRIAVYADFPPYSAAGKGIDIAVGKALAAKLGLSPQVVEFPPGETMDDDLRNMVWRGHYMGAKPGDVMLHVPVDVNFAAQNPQVSIFGPYHLEAMAMARRSARVPAPSGSAASALEVFTREKIGAETDTHASDFLLHVLNGRLRDNVVHFKTIADAAAALARDEIAAVIGTETQLQAATAGQEGISVDLIAMPEMRVSMWPIGLAVKADNKGLETALSDALADLQRSGELARLFTEHGLTLRTP